MTSSPEPLSLQAARSYPSFRAIIQLLKPITWFPPMWALTCGLVSAGTSVIDRWAFAVGAILLAGPLVCGTSQTVNDWFDREVDAINEPQRPIPSGRVPGRWGLYLAILWSAVSLLVAALLGPWVLGASVVGLTLAWAYSMPPLRLKANGWFGNTAVGLCYEGLPWFTGVAALTSQLPDSRSIAMAGLYSAGAFGIMILNDFKAVDGDSQLGVRSLPVQLGIPRAARLACFVMALPQIVVIALLVSWGKEIHAGIVGALLVVQLGLMSRFLRDPGRHAAWYNGTGTTLSVMGMLVSAFAIRSITLGGS